MTGNPIYRTLCRLRHRRGHGIHSPLVYSLVREVFMKRYPVGGELYETLLRSGIKRKYAREISRLYSYLGAPGFYMEAGSVYFTGGVRCMLSPRRQPQEYHRKVNARTALSIDRRGYALFFDDQSLPKQHFIL